LFNAAVSVSCAPPIQPLPCDRIEGCAKHRRCLQINDKQFKFTALLPLVPTSAAVMRLNFALQKALILLNHFLAPCFSDIIDPCVRQIESKFDVSC
jgi:hypothetical protein